MKLFKRVDKVLAKHDAMEADIKRRDGVPDPRPFAEQCEKVQTISGTVSHYKHPDPERGVICDELHDWPGYWYPAPAGMPVHKRCERAAQAEDQARAAS